MEVRLDGEWEPSAAAAMRELMARCGVGLPETAVVNAEAEVKSSVSSDMLIHTIRASASKAAGHGLQVHDVTDSAMAFLDWYGSPGPRGVSPSGLVQAHGQKMVAVHLDPVRVDDDDHPNLYALTIQGPVAQVQLQLEVHTESRPKVADHEKDLWGRLTRLTSLEAARTLALQEILAPSVREVAVCYSDASLDEDISRLTLWLCVPLAWIAVTRGPLMPADLDQELVNTSAAFASALEFLGESHESLQRTSVNIARSINYAFRLLEHQLSA